MGVGELRIPSGCVQSCDTDPPTHRDCAPPGFIRTRMVLTLGSSDGATTMSAACICWYREAALAGVSGGISKVRWADFALKIRGYFFQFWAVFDPFCQFRRFFGPDFSFFRFFRSPRDGILANESRPCTIAHPKQRLKQDVRPQPLSKK
jgi:hypothetical protein